MQTIEYRFEDKSNWGPGAWQDEPDKKQWQDEATGLPCLIVRNRLGALCGYVGVPRSHPAYRKDYDEVDVEVHGGLTFADKCSPGEESRAICHKVEAGENDDVWWLGFDCSHYGDLAPAYEARNMALALGPVERVVYRDFAYVTKQCEALAKQLAAMRWTP
jgi:hypothetical protein